MPATVNGLRLAKNEMAEDRKRLGEILQGGPDPQSLCVQYSLTLTTYTRYIWTANKQVWVGHRRGKVLFGPHGVFTNLNSWRADFFVFLSARI